MNLQDFMFNEQFCTALQTENDHILWVISNYEHFSEGNMIISKQIVWETQKWH